MPRFSKRKQVLRKVAKACKDRARFAFQRLFLDIEDDHEDLIDLIFLNRFEKMKRSRYLFRPSTYRKRDIKQCLDEVLHSDWLNDEEFLLEFRLSRTSFHLLVDLIKDNEVFKSGSRGTKPAPVEFQLLVLLRYLGLRGNGSSNRRMKNFFRAGGSGSMENWRNNAMEAILCLREQVIRWPNELERQQIAKRFERKFGWRNCVFIIDGTLFPLTTKPQLEDYPDYYGRKLGYTINAVILCDDERRILYYLAGNPGTCHDQRAWRQTPMYKQASVHFAENEYGLGDSAFNCEWFLLSAFSRPNGAPMARPQEIFNQQMSKPRVISEHVNGILKGRFPILNALPHIIKGKKSMIECLKCIDCCCILHNLLVGMKDDIPDGWRDEYGDEISDIDEADSYVGEIDDAVEDESPRDARQNQFVAYFNDIFF